MTLNDMVPGQVAHILDVHLEGAELQKMLDMGFVEGAEIRMVCNAPLHDPIDVSLKGYMVAIRRSEAKGVEVEL